MLPARHSGIKEARMCLYANAKRYNAVLSTSTTRSIGRGPGPKVPRRPCRARSTALEPASGTCVIPPRQRKKTIDASTHSSPRLSPQVRQLLPRPAATVVDVSIRSPVTNKNTNPLHSAARVHEYHRPKHATTVSRTSNRC